MVTYVRPGFPPLGHPDPAGYRGPVYADPIGLRIGQLEGRIATLLRQVEDQAGLISVLQHQFELLEEHHKELTKRVNQMAKERAEAVPAEPYETLVFSTKDGRRVKVTVQDA
jgi:hypothetical protein